MSEESQARRSQVSEEEGKTMYEALQDLADEWERRLEEPALKALVDSGQARVDPLILKLFELRRQRAARGEPEPQPEGAPQIPPS